MPVSRRQVFQFGAATGMLAAVPPSELADAARLGRVALANPMRPPRPPVVRVSRNDRGYGLTVDGRPVTIQGMGYNVLYRRHGLPTATRVERLASDLRLIRSIGANLVESWQPFEIDQAYLRLAYRNGLGAIPYHHLPVDDDYADPAVQEHHRQALRRLIELWRNEPAVWIWGIGNEVLLNARPEQASAFSGFYVTLVRDALQLDPTRPVIYRSAEDIHVPYFRDAFAATGGVPDQFVFGVNCYTQRLEQILDGWERHAFDVPVVVSEFAPAGDALDERPAGFRRLWEMIRGHDGRVLGGAVYTWTTDGPEATDEVFGLIDQAGHPVDDSLLALSELWGGSFGLPGRSRVVVPDLGGLALDEARHRALAAGLLLRPVEEVALAGRPAAIAHQTPPGGKLAERRTPIQAGVPPQPVDSTASTQLSWLFQQARDRVQRATGEPPEAFEARRATAEDAARPELLGRALTPVDQNRAVRLASWFAWIRTLSLVDVDTPPVFAGARHVVPVFHGLAWQGVRDPRTFTRARAFATATVREWVGEDGDERRASSPES